VFIQLNIGYIGIVINSKSVEILKTKYNLGDIISFKVVELDQNKKRYILDINSNNNNAEYNNAIKNENNHLTKSLNVCENSFYPQSYLKLVEGKNKKNENDKNGNNIMSNNKEISLYDILTNNNSNNNHYVPKNSDSISTSMFNTTYNSNNIGK
jgi:hypothetical protein